VSSLKIWCGFRVSPSAWKQLQAGVTPHTLALSRLASDSLLPPTPADEELSQVEVAFGQPDVGSILQSRTLRWVHLTTAGYTRYDTPEFKAYAKKQNLALTNSSSVYDEPCAQQVLAYMLAQTRALPASLMKPPSSGDDQWWQLRGQCRLLRGQIVLLLGYGAIAKRLIELLQPFGLKIVAFRKNSSGTEEVPIVSEDKLTGALAQADHVINALPASPSTEKFVNEARLSAMKRGAVFYNIGRGTTVDQEALHRALQPGRLDAAWLDVTEPEPLPADHPLRHQPNCFITPHTGGGFANETEALVQHFLENLKRFEKNEKLRNQVM
jgi:phosphoglycerate dehydrogenase-like enzyme